MRFYNVVKSVAGKYEVNYIGTGYGHLIATFSGEGSEFRANEYAEHLEKCASLVDCGVPIPRERYLGEYELTKT